MKFLIASTYLHLIDSIIISKQFKNEYFLFFIGRENEFLSYIKKLFSRTILLEEKKESFRQKVAQRIKNKDLLIDYVNEYKPEEIIVGNNRKIETSILIKNVKSNYSYMDDGLHSYIYEKNYFGKYSFLEKKIKKIIYRSSLELPKYIGKDLNKAYLFKPEYSLPYFKNKVKLDISLLKKDDFKDFANNLDLNFKKLILFPHSKFVNKNFLNKVQNLIDKDTAIKLHPRDKNVYFNNVKVIPNIPFEVLLLKINKDVQIYGMNSTALFMARLFNFDVYSYGINTFFNKIGVKEWI